MSWCRFVNPAREQVVRLDEQALTRLTSSEDHRLTHCLSNGSRARMRLTSSSLCSIAILSLCAACEVHIGTGDFDAAAWDDWDWDNNKSGDPWEAPHFDSGRPQGGSKAAADDDKDAGVSAEKDAAVSGDA